MQYTTTYEYDDKQYNIEIDYEYHVGIESYYTAYGWTPPEHDHIELIGVTTLGDMEEQLQKEISNAFSDSFYDSKLYENLVYLAREEFA